MSIIGKKCKSIFDGKVHNPKKAIIDGVKPIFAGGGAYQKKSTDIMAKSPKRVHFVYPWSYTNKGGWIKKKNKQIKI